MTHIQKIIQILFLSLLPMLVKASSYPMFDLYGITYRASIEEYQRDFLGKVVKFIPLGKNGSKLDIKYFIDKGGSFNSEYVIAKITGNKKKTILHLQEKGTNKIIKFEFYNYHSFGNEGFFVSPETFYYSLPLLLIEEFNEDRKYLVQKSNDNFAIDLILSEYRDSYPIINIEVTDKLDNSKYKSIASSKSDYINIGKTFSNPKFKCSYTIVGFNYETDKKFVVKNSINKKTKNINIINAHTEAFKGDDAYQIIASLRKVEKPSNSEIRYGDTKEITDSDKNITRYSYIDNFIDILIIANQKQFDFIIKNVSENTIKIVWNEAVFVDVDGSTSKVMHTGIKYSQKEADQPASVIIKNAKLEDIAIPINKIYYSDILNKWTNHSLFSNANKKTTEQTIRLMLPILVKDVINEYIFEFDLKYRMKHPELLVDSE